MSVGFDCRRLNDHASLPDTRCCLATPAADRRPVLWTHVPKTGSTFANSVFRCACDALPSEAIIRLTDTLPPNSDLGLVYYFEHCFRENISKCRLNDVWQTVGHHKLEKFEPNRVAYVTMLREPLERYISGYHHHHHDCRACTRDTTLLQYVRMVANEGYSHYFGNGDASVALDRIQNFAFVGLVEYWDMSICLYHSKFGGRLPVAKGEFLHDKSTRLGNYTAEVAAEELRDLRAALTSDDALRSQVAWETETYMQGARRFWADVRQYRCALPRVEDRGAAWTSPHAAQFFANVKLQSSHEIR